MISQFALRLIYGMALTWCVMPRDRVTCGFFRIQMLVALGLSVLAVLTCAQLDTLTDGRAWLSVAVCRALCAATGALAFTGSIIWTLARRRAGAVVAYLLAVLAAGTLLGTAPLRTVSDPLAAVLVIGGELASAWLVGGATTAMLLGHWYLTAPMMSLDPLQRLNRLFGGAAGARGVLAAVGLATVSTALNDTQAVWLCLRWAAGIVGPLVVCFLAARILRYRNTQSATGVLFAGVVLSFIGETTAALLSRDLRWPL
jgi:hypothetical protein